MYARGVSGFACRTPGFVEPSTICHHLCAGAYAQGVSELRWRNRLCQIALCTASSPPLFAEYLFESIKPIHVMPCGHTIHEVGCSRGATEGRGKESCREKG